MSDPLQTNHLKLPYLAAAQAQKHVTHNEALRRLDVVAQLAVLDASLTDPPATPAEGDRYIVADDATGDWEDHDGEVAAWVDGVWEFAEPEEGWLAFDLAGEVILVHVSGAWQEAVAAPGVVDLLGINATADTTNRLAVRSEAVLLSAIEDADGGSGDIRVIVNKEADADTASFLFQSGLSGRAEIGLAGDTDFVFKVSADGSAWIEAIRIDKDTGLPTILYDNGTSGLTATNVQDAIDEVAATAGGGAVASVFGRTGTVAAATSDYDASQVDNDSGVSGATVKDALDALAGAKAPLASPTFTGTPAAPTASAGTNTTQLATTAFVKAAIDVVLGGVSSAFDTLSEIATGLAGKLTASSNLSDVGSASAARTNLGLGTAATKDTGTSAGQVVLLDGSARLPAVDGSQLTNVGSATQELFNAEVALALADALNVAQFLGSSGNRVGDSFDALTYVDTAGATNLDSGTAGLLKPTTSVTTTTVNDADGTATIGSYTMIDRSAALANGILVTKIGIKANTAGAYVLKIVKRNSANNYDVVVSQSLSHTGGGGFEDLTLSSSYTVPGSGTFYLACYSALGGSLSCKNSAARAYVNANLTGTGQATSGEDTNQVFPLRYVHTPQTDNLTVRSTSFTAASAPASIKAVIRAKFIDSITVNTDLTAEVSRDGGTTWSAAALTDKFTTPGTSHHVLESAAIDVTGQPSGTSPRWRIKTFNNKSLELHDAYLYWQ